MCWRQMDQENHHREMMASHSLEGAGGMICGCERTHKLRCQEHLTSYNCISLGEVGKWNVFNILKCVDLTAFMENAASECL